MVGIVILNYNNSAQTIACVETLYRHCDRGQWKLCIVDNASNEKEYALLCSAFGESQVIIRSELNGGYASGNDLGCEYFSKDSSVDKILILNDDTRFTMDIITPLSAYLDAHPECGVVFPLVLSPSGETDKACMRRQKSSWDLFLQASSLGRLGFRRKEFLDPKQQGIPLDSRQALSSEWGIEVPPGSCMMLPKTLFREIGWLDKGTFLYFEEHIIAAKLKQTGLKAVLLPYVNIIHLGAATTAKHPSKTIYAHWRHSYLYFMKHYSSVPRPIQQFLRFRTWLKTLI